MRSNGKIMAWSRAPKPRLGSRGKPDASRAAILQAAIREFAREGVAGARIDAIARSAKVNKALLYYYYIDKETLYGETLDYVFQKRAEVLKSVLDLDLPPGEKVLRYVSVFFDYLAEYPYHREVVQREMLSLSRRSQMRRVIVRYVKPLYAEMSKVIQRGIADGTFRPVDPMQFIPMMGAIVLHYFGSAPLIKLITGQDPLQPEQLAARRAAMLDFISAALFAPNTQQGDRA
jgi:TetR/AcrR family transcriptional regulator